MALADLKTFSHHKDGNMEDAAAFRCPLCEAFYRRYPLEPDLDAGPHDEPMQHVFDRNEDGSPGLTSSPIVCAFGADGVFTRKNWCCETIGAVRALCLEDDEPRPGTFHMRDDDRAACIGVVHIPESEEEGVQQGYVVMSWYKGRGRTGQAWVFWDGDEPARLNLKTAEWLLKAPPGWKYLHPGEFRRR